VLFGDGTTFEMMGLRESGGGDFWSADGRAVNVEGGAANFQQSRRATTDPAERVVEALYHIHADTALRFRWFYYDFPGEAQEGAWQFTSPTDRKGILTITVPADVVRGDARVGMGMGGFATKVIADVTLAPTAKLTIRDAGNVSAAATTQAARVSFGDVISETDGELKIQFLDFRSPKERATTAAELAAISKEGKRTVITDSLHRELPNPYYFRVRTANLRSVVYLTRGIEWHTLRNVALRPTTGPATRPAM
jgi:hypothetical protein